VIKLIKIRILDERVEQIKNAFSHRKISKIRYRAYVEEKRKGKKINISWSPPQPMVWKWNVDGSTEGKPEPAGIYSRDFLEQ
jgi:hypothetical protein